MTTIVGKILRLQFAQAFKAIFKGLEEETKLLVPIAIGIVEGLKAVMDTPMPDVILILAEKFLPGAVGEELEKGKQKLREILPNVLLKLRLIKSISDITDINEQLNAILAEFKLSSNDSQNIFWHDFAALILKDLADGKLTLAECIELSQYYYEHITKVQAA